MDAEFVYDDNRQIEANQMIQNPKLFGQAMRSDVWAFKADGDTTVSNYWRPTFVAWMIINHQLAGLNSHIWHSINILLHFLVALLLFCLLRCWKLKFGMAFSMVALFTLHPIHVESVAWVAGSPDLLFSLFAISALLCWQYFIRTNTRVLKHWILLFFTLIFYALALGAKEVAIVLPPIFMLLAYWRGNVSHTGKQTLINHSSDKQLMAVSFLFVLTAIAYFIIRLQILGHISKPESASLPVSHFIYSLPQVISFYWQQSFLPLQAGANFPPRIIAYPSINEFWLAALLSTILLIVLIIISKKSRFQTLGLLMLLLPLLPALNLFAFHHEQLVHHRYLYLPILGLLMVLIPAWQSSVGQKFPILNYMVMGLLLTGYTYQSWRFSHIWQNNLTLWQHTVQVDPHSAFNWQQLANVHLENNNLDQATSAFMQSIAIQASPRSLYGLAKTQHLLGDANKAIDTLQLTISDYRTDIDLYLGYQIYELYAVILTANNQLAAAENMLRRASQELPEYQVLLGDKLAVVMYLQNKKSGALELLEQLQQPALNTTHMAAKMVFFRLAMLYDESKQTELAQASFTTFLLETQSNSDPAYAPYQKIARDYMSRHKNNQ